MKIFRYWYLPLFAFVLLLLVTPALADNNPNPGVLPRNSNAFGKTYEEWSAGWWQWLFAVPASQNSALATNGPVDCSVGQSGNVWFLSGNFQPGTYSRSCTIPAGKALFIPIFNAWADNVCFTPPLSVHELHALAESFVAPPADLHASVDGKPLTDLESYRAKSPVFTYRLPSSTDNLITAAFGVPMPGTCWPSLTVTPAVADGFYIMLAPLSKGSHTINFGGTGPVQPDGSRFTIDMTYQVTVGD